MPAYHTPEGLHSSVRWVLGSSFLPTPESLSELFVPRSTGWLMRVVPSRSYELDVRPCPESLEVFPEALSFLRDNHETRLIIETLINAHRGV